MFAWGFMDLYALQLKCLASPYKWIFGQNGQVYLPSCAVRHAYHCTCLAGHGWSIRCWTGQLFIYYPQPWVANFPVWFKRPFPFTDLVQPLYLQYSFSCWMVVVIHPQNNATFYQLLCLCCRYDLGTCVNQNGADIGMLDCDRRIFLLGWLKRNKLFFVEEILSIWHCVLRDFC